MNAFFIRYLISLVYGTIMTFCFGSIPLKSNRINIFKTIVVLLVVESILYANFGLGVVLKTYPIHTHLLLVLYLMYNFKMHFYDSLMYVLLSYMSCQIPAWFSKFSQYIFPKNQIAEVVIYLIFAIITAMIMIMFVGDSAKGLLKGSPVTKAVFGLIPITYYLFDYSTTFWTELLYSGNYHITQFMPLVLCIGYPVFIIGYHKEQQRSQQALQDKLVIEGNLNMIEDEIRGIQEIEMMSRIYRHDMRHHLQLLRSLIKENKLEQAQDYITENINAVAEVTPVRYCEIDILNLLLAHYANIAGKNQIPYHFDVKISEELPMSNMEICALVSNTLDNACQANMKVIKEDRKLELVFKEHNGMLIFSVDNAFNEAVENIILDHEEPWNKEHGFGTKSIEAIVKKYNGDVSFSFKDNIFSTMVIMKK